MATTSTERRQAHDKRKREAGFVRVCAWIPAEKKTEFNKLVAMLNEHKD